MIGCPLCPFKRSVASLSRWVITVVSPQRVRRRIAGTVAHTIYYETLHFTQNPARDQAVGLTAKQTIIDGKVNEQTVA